MSDAVEQEAFIVSASGPYVHKAYGQMFYTDIEDAKAAKDVAERLNKPAKYTVYRLLVRSAEEEP